MTLSAHSNLGLHCLLVFTDTTRVTFSLYCGKLICIVLPFPVITETKSIMGWNVFPDQCPKEIKYLNSCLSRQFQELFIAMGNACLLVVQLQFPVQSIRGTSLLSCLRLQLPVLIWIRWSIKACWASFTAVGLLKQTSPWAMWNMHASSLETRALGCFRHKSNWKCVNKPNLMFLNVGLGLGELWNFLPVGTGLFF